MFGFLPSAPTGPRAEPRRMSRGPAGLWALPSSDPSPPLLCPAPGPGAGLRLPRPGSLPSGLCWTRPPLSSRRSEGERLLSRPTVPHAKPLRPAWLRAGRTDGRSWPGHLFSRYLLSCFTLTPAPLRPTSLPV